MISNNAGSSNWNFGRSTGGSGGAAEENKDSAGRRRVSVFLRYMSMGSSVFYLNTAL